MVVKFITSLAEFQQIIKNSRISVFDLGSPQLGLVRVTSSMMESFSEKETQIDFYRVDIAQHQDISKQIGNPGQQMTVVYKDGKKIKELFGDKPAEFDAYIKSTHE